MSSVSGEAALDYTNTAETGLHASRNIQPFSTGFTDPSQGVLPAISESGGHAPVVPPNNGVTQTSERSVSDQDFDVSHSPALNHRFDALEYPVLIAEGQDVATGR